MPLQRYLFSIVKSQKDTPLQDLQEKFDIRQLARTSTQRPPFQAVFFRSVRAASAVRAGALIYKGCGG